MESDFESARRELWNGDEENDVLAHAKVYWGENWDEMWERKQRDAAVHVTAYGAYLVSLMNIYYKSKRSQESQDIVNMGKHKKMEAPATSSLRWTVSMDKVLIDALMNEVACDNRIDGQFTSQAYENILKECTEKLHHPFTKCHLQNRLKTIKRNFKEVVDIFGDISWGWNEETKMFDYEDEVWESLLQKKPGAKKWRNTPFHHFNLLTKLFSKNGVPSDDSYVAREKPLALTSAISESSEKDESTVDAKMGELKDLADSKQGKRKRMFTEDNLRNEISFEEFLREEISAIKQGLDNIAQALREGNKVMQKSYLQFYSTGEVYEELVRMELDPGIRRKAYRFLNAKQGRVRELLGWPLEERKDYLMDMMILEED